MARYWAYVHDLDGEMTKDLGDFSQFDWALTAVKDYLMENAYDETQHVVRIVDDEDEGQTCWIAGPADYMLKHYNYKEWEYRYGRG